MALAGTSTWLLYLQVVSEKIDFSAFSQKGRCIQDRAISFFQGNNHEPRLRYRYFWPCCLPLLGKRRFQWWTCLPPSQRLKRRYSRLCSWICAARRACASLERAVSLPNGHCLGRNCRIGRSHRTDFVLLGAVHWTDGDRRSRFSGAYCRPPRPLQCFHRRTTQSAPTWRLRFGPARDRAHITPRTSKRASPRNRAGIAGRLWLWLLFHPHQPCKPRCDLLATGGCTPSISALFFCCWSGSATAKACP